MSSHAPVPPASLSSLLAALQIGAVADKLRGKCQKKKSSSKLQTQQQDFSR